MSRIEQKINNLETIVLEQKSDSTPTSSHHNEIGADNISLRHIMSKLSKIEAKLGKNTHRRRNNRRWVFLRYRMYRNISSVRWQKEHLIRDFTPQYKNQYSLSKIVEYLQIFMHHFSTVRFYSNNDSVFKFIFQIFLFYDSRLSPKRGIRSLQCSLFINIKQALCYDEFLSSTSLVII